MKRIKLFKYGHALVDDEDYEYLSKYKWHLSARGYVARSTWVDNKPNVSYMHREVMSTPEGMDTDHKDMNKLNNQKSNLRICTRAQNMANARWKKKLSAHSKYQGVSKKNGRWLPYIQCDKKMHYMGTFDTEEEARIARDNKALELFGEFAKLNDV